MNFKDIIDELRLFADNLDHTRFHELLETGLLDEHYKSLDNAIAWINRLAGVHLSPDIFAAPLAQLETKRDEILDFYLDYFESHETIGSIDELLHPDYIFILACKDTRIMARRVDAARSVITRSEAPVVLCGGGFSPFETEADIMFDILTDAGIPKDRLYREDDSIDTVANAVFAKLLMRQQGLLSPEGTLVVVTSDFHVPRSKNIFEKVFGPGYRVSLVAAATDFSRSMKKSLAAHELSSDSRSSGDIFCIRHPANIHEKPLEQITPGDEVTLFYQLILMHDFYKNRYDLIRKFKDVLS